MSPLSPTSHNTQRAPPPPIKTSYHHGTLRAYSPPNNENSPPTSDMSPSSSQSYMASTKSSRSAKMEPPSKLPRRAATPSSVASNSKMSWVNTAARKVGMRRPSVGRKQKEEEEVLPPTQPLPQTNGPRPSVSVDAANRTAYTLKYSMNKPLPNGPPPEKPLPSPPVLVVASTTSPVHPSRTLIDASERPLRLSPGTPEEREWPALSPEPSQTDLRAMVTKSSSQPASNNEVLRHAPSTRTLGLKSSESTLERSRAVYRFNANTPAGNSDNAVPASDTAAVDKDSTINNATTDEIKVPRPLRHRYNFSKTNMADGTKVESRLPRAMLGTQTVTPVESSKVNSHLPVLSGTNSIPRKPMPPPSLPFSGSQARPDVEIISKPRTNSSSLRTNIPSKPSSLPSLRKSSSASFRSHIAAMNSLQPKIPAAIQDSPEENVEGKSEASSSETRKTQESVASTTKSSNSSGIQLRGPRANVRKFVSQEPISMSSSCASHNWTRDLPRLPSSSTNNGSTATLTIENDTEKSTLDTSDQTSDSSDSPLVPSLFRSSWIDSKKQSTTTSPHASRNASTASGPPPVPASNASTRNASSESSNALTNCSLPPNQKTESRKIATSFVCDVVGSSGESTCIAPQSETLSDRLRIQARANALSMLEGRISSPTRDGSSSFRSQRSTSPHANVLLRRFGTNEHSDTDRLILKDTNLSVNTSVVPEDQQSKLSESTAPTSAAPSTTNKERSYHDQPPEAPVTSIKLRKNQTANRKPSIASSHGTVKRDNPAPAVPAKPTMTNYQVRPKIEVASHVYSPHRFPSMASSAYSKDRYNDQRESQIYNIPRMASSVKLPQSNVSTKSPSRLREKMANLRNLFHKREHKNSAKASCSASVKSKVANERRITVTSAGSPLPTVQGSPELLRSRSKTNGSARISPSPSQILNSISASIMTSSTGHDSSPNQRLKSMLLKLFDSTKEMSDTIEKSRVISIVQAMNDVVESSTRAKICLEQATQAAIEAKFNHDRTEMALRRINSVLENYGVLSNIVRLGGRVNNSGR